MRELFILFAHLLVTLAKLGQPGGLYSPYTKGNFQFERVVTGWRNIPILDLRLKR